MIDIAPWLILTPLFWAAMAFLHGPGRGASLATVGIALQLVLALLLAVGAADAPIYQIGGWQAPLGIELMVDGLAAIMLVLTQAVALPLALYARAYFSIHPEGLHYFWPLKGFLLAAMNALFLSNDIFNLYVTLELVSLAAVGLVAAHGSVETLTAALRYLLATLLGSGAYLLGVAIFYGAYGTVSISLLASLITNEAPNAVFFAAGLMIIGLMLKTALFPFHFWLPPAHGGTPSPVSALLSALVIKASFYLILRLWLGLLMPLTSPLAAQLAGLLGAAAILWGSMMALRQSRLKMLIAYSTVAQIGYLFLLFPLVIDTAPIGAQSAFQGAVIQALAHAFAKAAMFCAAGAVILSTGSDEIDKLGGVSRHLPLSLFTFGLAGVTLMGLPPSSGFLAKWLLIDGALIADQSAWVIVIILGGLFTAAYVFRVLRHAFLNTDQSPTFRALPVSLEWSAFFLALVSIMLGFSGTGVIALLGGL